MTHEVFHPRILGKMKRINLVIQVVLLGCAGTHSLQQGAAASIDFESQVRPILAEHCFGCHGDEKRKGGLRLSN